MKLIFVLMLCGTGLCSVIQRNLVYVSDHPMSWQDARAKCQSKKKELVTFVAQSEIDETNMDSYYAWIALRHYDDWKWFDGDNKYLAAKDNFIENEPACDDNCALDSHSGDRAEGDKCEKRHFFFCNYQDQDNIRKYNFYPETKSWDDAFQFCKDTNQVLAIYNQWDGQPSDEKRDFPVWTGLYHDGESWSWSDGEYSDYWKDDEEYLDYWKGTNVTMTNSSLGSGLCGAVWSQNKTMSVHKCSEAFPFLCYSPNLVLVKQNLTWEEALERCEAISPSHSHQLLSVEPSDLLYANMKALDAETDKVWLGLRFLGGSWFWSNREMVSLPGLPSCPEATLGCGALVLDRNSNGSELQPTLELRDCAERLNLLCYRLK